MVPQELIQIHFKILFLEKDRSQKLILLIKKKIRLKGNHIFFRVNYTNGPCVLG